jgi:hypothetical protein
MRNTVQLWLLLPHTLSAACFAAAFAWASYIGTNRTMPDLYLAIGGFGTLVAAVIATIVALIFVFKSGVRRFWPWLSVHLA